MINKQKKVKKKKRGEKVVRYIIFLTNKLMWKVDIKSQCKEFKSFIILKLIKKYM